MEFLHPRSFISMFFMFPVVAGFAPRDTQLSTNRSTNVFQQGDTVALNCSSSASPTRCSILFYQGNYLLANISSNTSHCSAIYVITSIQGCNHLTLSCMASNVDGNGKRANLTVNIQAKPKINVKFANANNYITAIEGSSFELKCSSTGCPTPNVTKWTKQHLLLKTAQNSTLEYSFARISRNDTGQFTCTADNGIAGGPFNKTITLDVQYKPEKTRVSVNKTGSIFKKSEVTKITCKALANPSRCTIFLYNGNTLLESAIAENCSHSYVYTFDGCGQDELRCIVQNAVGKGPGGSLKVTIQARPEVSTLVNNVPKSKVDVEEGQSLTIQCKATGCPTPFMVWKKASVVTDSDTSYILAHPFTDGLKKEDTGLYICMARNLLGNASPKAIHVNVVYKPIITSLKPFVTLTTNQGLNLTCKAEANPSVGLIQWMRNNSAVIARGENLWLNASESLPGDYECVARNSVGTSTKTTVVNIKACAHHQCLHKSKCVRSRGTTYQCNCTKGYVGQFCQNKDSLSATFRVRIVLTSTPWRNHYTNPSSTPFKSLENTICSEFRNVLRRFQMFTLSCKVLSFRNGSVVSEVELKLNETKYRSEVDSSLRRATSNNTLGSLVVSSSLNVFVGKPNVDPCGNQPCKNEGKCIVYGKGFKCECKRYRYGKHCDSGISLAAGIVLIVLACLVVLIIIIALIIYCCRRMGNHASFQKDSKPLDTELKSVRRRGSITEYPMGITNQMYMGDDNKKRSGSYNIAKVAARNSKFDKAGSNAHTRKVTAANVYLKEGSIDENKEDSMIDDVNISNNRVRFKEGENMKTSRDDTNSEKANAEADANDDVKTDVKDSTSANGVTLDILAKEENKYNDNKDDTKTDHAELY